MTDDGALTVHVQELRRGTVVLACLAMLDEPGYGYALLEALEAAGFDVEGNTLYPLLRRMEKQGLLSSEWNTEESRPRKFYRTSPEGRRLRSTLIDEWRSLNQALRTITKESS